MALQLDIARSFKEMFRPTVRILPKPEVSLEELAFIHSTQVLEELQEKAFHSGTAIGVYTTASERHLRVKVTYIFGEFEYQIGNSFSGRFGFETVATDDYRKAQGQIYFYTLLG